MNLLEVVTCIVHVDLLHCKLLKYATCNIFFANILNMFSLLILIIVLFFVNIVFYFVVSSGRTSVYLRTQIKSIQIATGFSIIGNNVLYFRMSHKFCKLISEI